MKTIKLIVTHQGQLAKKYRPQDVKKIEKAVASLVTRDKARQFTTHYVHLDNPTEMKKYGVGKVTGTVTPGKCKIAIDGLFAALSPDYLVLLGAGDIIPDFKVANPSFDPDGDDDEQVPTDNPYACSRPFQKSKRQSYLIPDRVVGRIPDLRGKNPDPAWLLDYLKVAEAWEFGTAKDYSDDLFVCCDTWKKAGAACVAYLSRKGKRLMISPPVTVDAVGPLPKRYGARLHMIKCHGAPLDANFYGQKGQKYPAVIHSTLLQGKTIERTVVGAMCCYGALLFDPDDPKAIAQGEPPIPSLYLRQGAYGFFGSTTIAWVGFNDMQCADWIIGSALRSVLRGASLGRAMLESKQNLVKWINQQGRNPDLAEEKTLLQFYLLGDPSVHLVPVLQPSSLATAALPASRAAVAARALGPADERRMRRYVAHQTGAQLRGALPDRKVVSGHDDIAAGALKAMEQDKKLGLAGFGFGRPLVHQVTSPLLQPELTTAGMRGVVAARGRATPPVACKETLEYYWVARKNVKNSRIINARMVKVEADKSGAVIRTQVLVSS